MNPLFAMSGTELGQRIRQGELTSSEVVAAHIERIQQWNPRLNAVVANRFSEATKEAAQADEQRKQQDPATLPWFHGVPCTIKESFQVKGMPHTSGLLMRKGIRSTSDAVTVKRIRETGAIPLGVTNTPELCMWMESDNPVYGRSNNPYRQERTPGGSSGGEGAIVGAGASPFGLGSDIAGSIRIPAFFSGVFGHKPTGGAVPSTGQFPLPEAPARPYLCTGPLCRKAEDLMPILRHLAGPDGEDESCQPFEWPEPADVNLADLHIVNVPNNGLLRVSDDLQRAQTDVCKHFAGLGLSVETKEFEQLRRSFDIWSSMLGESSPKSSFRKSLGYENKRQLTRELGRWIVGHRQHTIPALFLAFIENLDKHAPRRAKYFIEMGRELRTDLLSALGTNGLMLFPSYTRVAPKHNESFFPPIHWVYTGIINMMGLPATQIPLGLNEEGLPLGIQVIAAPGMDHLCIAAAIELERAFGGWVVPPIRNH
jgi:fatty acid amide hydrolase 2